MKIYPLIRDLVTGQEWRTVVSGIPYRNDPVFGERTRADYERLYREIEARHS